MPKYYFGSFDYSVPWGAELPGSWRWQMWPAGHICHLHKNIRELLEAARSEKKGSNASLPYLLLFLNHLRVVTFFIFNNEPGADPTSEGKPGTGKHNHSEACHKCIINGLLKEYPHLMR